MHKIKLATGAALIAIVASATTAGATALISGSQIQGHSIPLSKLTSAAVNALRGHNGRNGSPGQAGIAHMTLIQGPAASQCAVGGGACQVATSTASCPAGTAVISGGYTASVIDNVVESSVPGRSASGTNEWNVVAENQGAFAGDVTAWAVCVSGPGVASSADVAAFRADVSRLRDLAARHP